MKRVEVIVFFWQSILITVGVLVGLKVGPAFWAFLSRHVVMGDNWMLILR